jgi:excisionase family DNA binding protein
MMTVEEAAKFLRVAKQTMYVYTLNKRIPFYKVGSRTLFNRNDLISWLESKKNK